jgi:hypothetical protein
MHRIWATLLVAVFSFTLIGPDAFGGRADQELPPCCRANGKHHCAMAQSKGGSLGPGVASRPLFVVQR